MVTVLTQIFYINSSLKLYFHVKYTVTWMVTELLGDDL
jgi:hypothetical protein